MHTVVPPQIKELSNIYVLLVKYRPGEHPHGLSIDNNEAWEPKS